MKLGKLTKQSDEKLDFDVDFSEWLTSCGDTPANVNVETDPGLTVGDYDVDVPTGIARVWVADGEDGEQYKVTITLRTTNGRIKQVEVLVKIKNT